MLDGTRHKSTDNVRKVYVQLIKEIVDMYKLHNMKTKVLEASITSAQDIVPAALSGTDAVTVSTETIRNLIRSPFSKRMPG